ncbi:MAG: UvrD-helicase domain-containing protein [Alphaproteobacteria bacterium]|nr:UvrD-helicase domain-containing protein [Alphaproteobacteria bacterium]
MMQEPEFLSVLNPEQKEAVTTTEGPVLVLSGAGTGKTRVLTTRIAYILAMHLAHPWQVLAVTFTNKAAREMGDRLQQMVGPIASSVWLGTFHRIGVRILRKYGGMVGLQPNFVVLDSDDQERLLKNILKQYGVDVKKYAPSIMLDIIQRWKDRGLAPEAVTRAENSEFCEGRTLDFYKLYQQRLQELNAVDFGDLLLLPLQLFQKNPEILAEYQGQFHYILVDEYQDTNVAQYMLLRLLAKGYNNICCVGDDDQSIYSWRGADVDNILNFAQVFPDAKIIRLERNYRSTGHILAAAASIISHNVGRLGKTLHVADEGAQSGNLVSVQGFWNGTQEAEKVVEQIEDELHKGTPLSHMAILVRASFQTREFEDVLIHAGIPYKIIGGFKFYEREEIRDAVAYLRLALNPHDDLAFIRVVNKPRRGIGDTAMQTLQTTAIQNGTTLIESIENADLKAAAKKSLTAFKNLVLSWYEKAQALAPMPLLQEIMNQSGYLMMWQMDKSPEAEGRIENIHELYNVLNDFESVQDFVEYASLLNENDEQASPEQLVVMTLHASKGLEFDTVFLPGWEEGLFPHQRAMEEAGEKGLEEERRLAYVGITRARQFVFISYASNRRVYGQWQNALPSRFIDELPEEHIDNKGNNRMGLAANFADVRMPWAREKQAINKRRVGQRVHHETFGDGVVIRENGETVEVAFNRVGIKKILARFLENI